MQEPGYVPDRETVQIESGIKHSSQLFEDTGIVRVNQPVRDGDGLFLLHLHVPQSTIHVQAIGRWNTFY